MKIRFTTPGFARNLPFFCGILLSWTVLSGQTTHQVDVSSNVFTPANITVNTGDQVVWTNTQGNHNVNGKTSVYPSNPESFGNSVAGPGWTYSHVFTIPGTYDYRCDPHVSIGMVGTVTVLSNDPTTSEATLMNNGRVVSLFPNPVRSVTQVNIEGYHDRTWHISIFNTTGVEVMKQKLGSGMNMERELNLSEFESGIYFVKVYSDKYHEVFRIVKQ